MKSPLLSLQAITKSFPGVLANDRIDLQIYGGEVHALLGENGAGKSTLMKVLYGFYRADSGEVLAEGRPVEIHSPQEARRLRIGMVFQDFVQIPAMSVAENIALFLPDLPAILEKSRLIERIRDVSEKYTLAVNPQALVGQLSVGERQKLELLKLLLADARILIFDEPTRSLAPHEIEGLFRTFVRLKAEGYAILFITHKLKEVLQAADRITVMRRGRVAGMVSAPEATEDGLISLMFGEEIPESIRQEKEGVQQSTMPLLRLEGITTQAEGVSGPALQNIQLSILPGEIVGVAGVSGNGQKELGDVVLGLKGVSKGSKYLDGRNATRWSVSRIRASGVGFIPEDPLHMAAFAGLTVQENMALGNIGKYIRHGGFTLNWKRVRRDFETTVERLGFSMPSLQRRLGTLSGGNVQRVILVKEMAHDPRLIIAFYPTRGLDVRSAAAVRDLLLTSRGRGAGILLISEDLPELFSLSDRLIVLFHGRIVGESTPGEITMNEVGYLMTGSKGTRGPSA